MAQKKQAIKVDTTASGAVNTAFEGITELAEEMRSWYDNMPENLQYSDKGQEVEEAATTLENISEPQVPEFVAELPVSFYTQPQPRKASRQRRLDDYLDYARIAVGELETALETYAEDEEKHSDLQACIEDVQSMIDDAEGVAFPGMY